MITSGLEDYLELIHNTISQNKEIKAVDIANKFNISRPSVSEALIRLADLDLSPAPNINLKWERRKEKF